MRKIIFPYFLSVGSERSHLRHIVSFTITYMGIFTNYNDCLLRYFTDFITS